MPGAFMMTQQHLQDTLNDWVVGQSGDTYTVKLFKNDYVPVDATVEGDLEECDFAGYAFTTFDPVDFGAPTWTPYVAQILLNVFLTWTASGSMVGTQIAYGYYVEDGDSNFVWAERWDTPFEFSASSVLNMKPALRQRTCRES